MDDDVSTATSLYDVLQVIGCKAAIAFGGDMALRIAKLFQPNLVLLDLRMPGKNGCEVLAALKESDGPVAHALFVCLSGDDAEVAEQVCRAAGFDRFIPKPLSASQLRDLIAEALSRSLVRESLYGDLA